MQLPSSWVLAAAKAFLSQSLGLAYTASRLPLLPWNTRMQCVSEGFGACLTAATRAAGITAVQAEPATRGLHGINQSNQTCSETTPVLCPPLLPPHGSHADRQRDASSAAARVSASTQHARPGQATRDCAHHAQGTTRASRMPICCARIRSEWSADSDCCAAPLSERD